MRNLTTTTNRYPAALPASLIVLGAIVTFALIGLALAGKWPKVARVGAAAATYAIFLLIEHRSRPELRLAFFLAAGAAAGAVSGLLRASTSWSLVVASTLGAALLLAPLHWWALRTWQAR